MSPTAAGAERYGDVLFAASRTLENERLEGLAAAFDPASRQNLLSLGLNAQWTCLDLGAGTGTLSGWLASVTESAGQVTAVDRDTRFLDPLAALGVKVVEADITDPEFQPGQFDLVHARFVLMHLRERHDLLPRLASWVKPGGSLVVSDSLAIGGETSPHGPYRHTITALWRMLAETIGTDRHYAGQYPQGLTDLGLHGIGMHAHLPVVGIDAGFTRFLQLTLDQGRDKLLAAGLPATTYEEAATHLAQPLSRELFFAMLTCWGRKPAAH